jgi:hypothetical protein
MSDNACYQHLGFGTYQWVIQGDVYNMDQTTFHLGAHSPRWRRSRERN